MRKSQFIMAILLSIVAAGCSITKSKTNTVQPICEWDDSCGIMAKHTHTSPKDK